MNKIFLRNILITVLVLALVIGGIVKLSKKEPDKTASVAVDIKMAGVDEQLSESGAELISGITSGTLASGAVSGFVKRFMYSDEMVSTIMSVSYPLLYTVLLNLEMLDFEDKMDLYPTGPELAAQLQGTTYTCCDKDGVRKPLTEVLTATGEDWNYMATEIAVPDASGSVKTQTLWNTIEWGITDKDSFYKAMQDMSTGLRGVFEVCIQGKTRVISINVIEFILKTDAIPLNMDAATIYNASEKTGYELCLIKLFNMLGLQDGEYPTTEEVVGYTELSDIWKALLEPIISVVGKAETEPMTELTNMLVNFVHAVDSGELVESMRTLRMDADFHPLASLAMGFKDGLLHNLGDSLISTIEAMGIKITGSFNELLDSLIQMLYKDKVADLPEMDTEKLMSYATPETLPNGNVHYVADAQGVTSFLLNYAITSDMIKALINNPDYNASNSATLISGAVDENRDAIVGMFNTILGALVFKTEGETETK